MPEVERNGINSNAHESHDEYEIFTLMGEDGAEYERVVMCRIPYGGRNFVLLAAIDEVSDAIHGPGEEATVNTEIFEEMDGEIVAIEDPQLVAAIELAMDEIEREQHQAS